MNKFLTLLVFKRINKRWKRRALCTNWINFPTQISLRSFSSWMSAAFTADFSGGKRACSLVPYNYIFIAVPLLLKNFLRCSPKFILLSSHVPRNYAPCSLDPQKYSSLFPTISLMFHFHFHLIKRLPCHYFKKVSLWGKICLQENSHTTEKQIRT